METCRAQHEAQVERLEQQLLREREISDCRKAIVLLEEQVKQQQMEDTEPQPLQPRTMVREQVCVVRECGVGVVNEWVCLEGV